MTTETESYRPLHESERYDELLENVDASIEQLVAKIENGRIRNPEYDKVRVRYHRTLGYMVRTKCRVLDAKNLEELSERLEKLENQ
jgi:hypothetical protein